MSEQSMKERVREKKKYVRDIEPEEFVRFILKFQREEANLLDKLRRLLKLTS